jgi:hypothetical protein
MLSFGALSFAAPWALAALIVLPILWWLLRLTPPSPKRIGFPAIRLLFGLKPREETPDRTPWWLILLRLAIAALLILAMARPVWNSNPTAEKLGDLLLVLDDGWASANGWQERQAVATDLINGAGRRGGKVMLLTTAPHADGSAIALRNMTAGDAASLVSTLAPQPWPVDRKAARQALDGVSTAANTEVVWLTDSIASTSADLDDSLAQRLRELGAPRILTPSDGALPILQLPPRRDAEGITVKLVRPMVGAVQSVSVRAQDREGHGLGTTEVTFAADQATATGHMALPLELKNRVSQMSVDGQSTAAAVALLSDSGGHKPIGLISDNPSQGQQPLLGELYYIERALAPNNEVRIGDLTTLTAQPLSMLILPDQTALTGDEVRKLQQWVERGGTLVRFAGERLATVADDQSALLPVRLRRGDRAVGGALSWSAPLHLAAFPDKSPFAGLQPTQDVSVRRQVLAEPDIDLGNRTWARLSDGTPLVTGAQRGKGYVVLFHTSANADWSDLVLSGLFVQMLDRLVLTSEGIPPAQETDSKPLPPAAMLDGFGHLGPATATALPITPADLAKGAVSPRHPPGFYGVATARRALNLSPAIPRLASLGLASEKMRLGATVDLKPWALLAVLLLLATDQAIALALRGLIRGRWSTAAAIVIAFGLTTALGYRPAEAATLPDSKIIELTQTAHLGYIRTGVPQVDSVSKAGLVGLTSVLLERTAADVGDPVAIDLETDDLTFFPVIYWPVTASQPTPSQAAIAKLNKYLANGGLILFDTADQNLSGFSGGDGSAASARLQELTAGMNLPPLRPVPADHVLTRAFYLLKDFPGRWVGSTLWVEVGQDQVNDGVAGIIVGGNDYAAAWAIDNIGRPMFPVSPGGERQREMAYRFGINLVMYALTGNYKSDQVHVPAILERLGQ